MIDKMHGLSISKQAQILGISRSSVYYQAEPVSEPAPSPGHVFLSRRFSRLRSAISSFSANASAGRITGQPLLARLQKFLQPAVIQALGDRFLASKLSNSVLATKARQNDSDLLLRRMQFARRTPDIFHDLLSRRLRRLGFLHHLQLQLG